MTTLDELIYDQAEPADRSGELQAAFEEAFDLQGWQFVQQGSIPYAILDGTNGPNLNVTAIQNGNGLEWQLNGVTFMTASDAELDLEARRMRLVDAAKRAQYTPAATVERQRSKP